MVRRIPVPFDGDGAGIAELPRGQQELWRTMRMVGNWMPIPVVRQASDGTTTGFELGELPLPVPQRAVGPALPGRGALPSGQLQQLRPGRRRRRRPVTGSRSARSVLMRVAANPSIARWQMTLTRYAGLPRRHTTPMRTGQSCTKSKGGVLEPALHRRGRPSRVVAVRYLHNLQVDHAPTGQNLLRHNVIGQPQSGAHRRVPAHDEAQFGDDVRDGFTRPAYRSSLPYQRVVLESPATQLAAHAIAERLREPVASVLLTLFSVARARVSGVDSVVVMALSGNRFRPGLADVVSPVTRPALGVVNLAL